ncbi:MAG: cupin domain-containing protein [Propionibacteriales bacterium]|nr:cupin domain-containing protein [Propionibacteriales bacterium]
MSQSPDPVGGERGGVVRLSELEPRTDLPGHPGLSAYRFVRPPEALSRWLLVTLDVVEHGGGIDLHHHAGLDADHAYYVIEGTVTATIGDETFEAGPDSLLVFPSGMRHGLTVTSETGARLLRLGASPTGRASGGSVFVQEEIAAEEDVERSPCHH